VSQSVSLSEERPLTRTSLLARHPLVSYFILAYVIAWLIWLPLLLSRGGGIGLIPFTTDKGVTGLTAIFIILGSFGPALAALIMTAVTEGGPGVRLWLLRFVRVRVGVQWYLIALLLPLLVLLVSRLPLLGISLVSRLFSAQGGSGFAIYVVSVIISLVIGSPLGEEPGWRGFALHRLEQHMGALRGSLVLGVLWACWHLPLALFSVWGLQYQVGGFFLPFLLFILTVISYTIVMTWVFNNTRGSIFIAILFHAAVDTSAQGFLILLYPELAKAASSSSAQLTSAVVILVLALSLVPWAIIAGIVLLATRGTLSYRPSLQNDVRPAVVQSVPEPGVVPQ